MLRTRVAARALQPRAQASSAADASMRRDACRVLQRLMLPCGRLSGGARAGGSGGAADGGGRAQHRDAGRTAGRAGRAGALARALHLRPPDHQARPGAAAAGRPVRLHYPTLTHAFLPTKSPRMRGGLSHSCHRTTGAGAPRRRRPRPACAAPPTAQRRPCRRPPQMRGGLVSRAACRPARCSRARARPASRLPRKALRPVHGSLRTALQSHARGGSTRAPGAPGSATWPTARTCAATSTAS